MTNQQHPITPSPELVRQWLREQYGVATAPGEATLHVATQAARWGADQELEACCEWIYKLMDRGLEWSMDLRVSRRSKPPSLKEQALKELKDWTDEKHGPGGEVFICEGLCVSTIRRALEQLDD